MQRAGLLEKDCNLMEMTINPWGRTAENKILQKYSLITDGILKKTVKEIHIYNEQETDSFSHIINLPSVIR